MAQQPIKPRNQQPAPISGTMTELQNALFSSNHGLSKDFIGRHENIVKHSNKAAADVLTGYGVSTINEGRNSIQELAQLVQGSVRYKSNQQRMPGMAFDQEDISGIRGLTPMGNIDQSEQEIISQNAMMYQSFLSITSEYRGVVNIIPELQRAIDNIVRDIINTSELSKRFLNNVYIDKHNRVIADKTGKNEIDRCNELIQKEIIDKNKLEGKFERWIRESVISGVKPVAFIPYDYIIRQLSSINKKTGENIIDVDKIAGAIKSGESCPIVSSENNLSVFYSESVEGCVADMVRSSDSVKSGESAPDMSTEAIFEDMIDETLVTRYMETFDKEFSAEVATISDQKRRVEDKIQRNSFLGLENNSAMGDLDLISGIEKSYTNKKEKLDTMTREEKTDAARKGLTTLAKWIDTNIDVVKANRSAAFIANRVMQEKDRYSNFCDLGKDYKIPENLLSMGYTAPAKKEEFDTKSSIGKECLIVPYSPESIIPINVNGEYMGFYCLEYEHLLGPMWKNRSKTGSFTDYIQQQGYGSDSNLLGGNSTMMAHGGTDPLENNLYSPASLYNYSASQYLTGNIEENDQRLDMMKTVAMRVLAHRLHDPDLVDNKVFKDSVMHLLRNDVLTRKKVQFTYVPPEYMCYMTYKTDDSGLPVSILDGTLFFAYLYISSVVASGMIKLLKSSDKEKYEIDVGLQKNIGYSVDEIQRCLSTRTLYTQSMFSSLSSVIKNAGSYQRLIIPVIKDKKLYDVTQIEHMNDLNPDDEFTGKCLQAILNKIYINSGAMSEFDNVDFAKQLSMRNLEYRNNIVKAQSNYEPYLTKALRILVHFSQLRTYNSEAETLTEETKNDSASKQEQMLDVSCIEVQLSPPTFLTMTNIIEVVNTAKDLANSLAEAYDLTGGNPLADKTAALFKRKIVKKYVSIMQFDEIDTMLDEAQSEAASEIVAAGKRTKIDESITEMNTGDTTASGGDPMGGGDGFGGGDTSGDDSSGGGGGDDFGGGLDGLPSI